MKVVRMRFDNQRRFVTLEEDIVRIWKKMKTPKFVMLIYDDRSCKGYTWNAFLKATNVAAKDYAKKMGESHEKNTD